MAVSTIPQIIPRTLTDTSVPDCGTSAYTINDCKRILCGKTVYISVRITANTNDGTGTTRMLVKLDAYPPKTTGGIVSIVSINGTSSVRTVTACGANIAQSGGSFWLCQGITNTINSGDVISIFAVYEAA